MRKTPNISVSYYEGDLQIDYDCPEKHCKYGFYDIMPKQKDAVCCFYNYKCDNQLAQFNALDELNKKLTKELDKLIIEEE